MKKIVFIAALLIGAVSIVAPSVVASNAKAAQNCCTVQAECCPGACCQ